MSEPETPETPKSETPDPATPAPAEEAAPEAPAPETSSEEGAPEPEVAAPETSPADTAPAPELPISDEAPIVRPREPLPTPTPHPSARNSPTGRYLREGIVGALRQPFLRSLLKIPLKKVAIWASFGFLLYALRDFFGLIFLTFVISYISAAIVGRISPHFTNRKVPVVLVFSAIIGAVVSLGLMTVPRAVRQGEAQLEKLRKIKDFRGFLEAEIAKRFGAELPKPSATPAPGATPAHPAAGVAEVGSALVGGSEPAPSATPEGSPAPEEGDKAPEIGLVERARRVLNNPDVNQAVAKMLAKGGQDYLIPNLKSVVQGIWGGAAYFVAALIFSFMIVWDLPRLASGAGKMEQSRLGDVWVEVAPSIATFFRLLGKAFEAQTVIALVNTAITALGMWFLGIPGIPFLAVIVFVCSFIPIVGMFVSTVPICIVALQVGGFGLVFGVIVMVAVAHALEAYVLNPRIYGFHMKLHPLAVLIVLYLGQHLFGVWGLVIGVPMATYVWRHLIMGEADEANAPRAPAAAPPADEAEAAAS